MNILLFGATGHLGSRILEQALEGGHSITAFVRDPTKLGNAPHLKIIQGDARDAETVAKAMPDHEAVISALGPSGMQNPPDVISVGTRNIVDGMTSAGLTRLISVAAAGILPMDEHRLRRDAPGFPPFLRGISAEHLAVWQMLEATNLDWTLICPPNMPPGERAGTYRVRPNAFPEGGQHISLQDAAHFVMHELNQGAFIRERVGIAY